MASISSFSSRIYFFLASATILFLSLTTLTSARPHPSRQFQPIARATLPPYFLLAGDSTTHIGSGWGDGFLNFTLKSPAKGINHGISGASLPSFRSKGYWATVLSEVQKFKNTRTVFVTIQFGHNDQKSAADEEAYSANLKQYVLDVDSAGGVPIILTPLSRRGFKNGLAVENLANETAKALAVAASTSSRFIDLNKASTKYINAIGETAAHKYNLSPSDNTHLDLHGSVVFGRLVSDLLVAKYADIKAYTTPNATLSGLLAAGKYA